MLLTGSRRILFEPVDSNTARLLYSSRENEAGILFRITGVLFVHGWSIEWAHVRTQGDGQVDDIFSIHRADGRAMDLKSLEMIEADLDRLLGGTIDMNAYLSEHPGRVEALARTVQHSEQTRISIRPGTEEQIAVTNATLHIDSPDRTGMLFVLTQTLFVLGYDIVRFEASTEQGQAHDSFDVRRTNGTLLDVPDRMQLVASLQAHL